MFASSRTKPVMSLCIVFGFVSNQVNKYKCSKVLKKEDNACRVGPSALNVHVWLL